MGKFSFSHITRHSIILVAAGLSFVAMGLSIQNYIVGGPRYELLVVARNVMPLDWWGWMFILSGLTATIFAHWPHIARTWGYIILTGVSVAWAMFYIMGTVLVKTRFDGLSQGAFWLLQGFIWWSISGLPDVAKNGKLRMFPWIASRKTN